MVRLQKFLAESGVASRRASEQMILAGKVCVNGRRVREMGIKVDPAQDEVLVDGRPVRALKKLYLALHKPPGYVSTCNDPEGRKTVLDLLPKEKRGVYPVGRLDRRSEGLIFLTNDGSFSLKISHPRHGIRKKYVATVRGRLRREIEKQLVEGVNDKGELLKAFSAKVVSASNLRSVIEVELTEGKNREVRRLLEAFDHPVTQLVRVQIGRIKLGDLPAGKWRTLTDAEINSLLKP